METDCALCGDLPSNFAENEVATARLSDEFACEGHTVLTARAHVENISDLSVEDARLFFDLYRVAEQALIDLFGADKVLAVKLGLAVPHLHIHLYPVSRDISRAEVDAMLARTVRVEVSTEEVAGWLEALRAHCVSEPRSSS